MQNAFRPGNAFQRRHEFSSQSLYNTYRGSRIHFAASEDYIPLIQMVYFPPFSEYQTVHVTIRDDQGLPRMEGTEEFELVLRTPINTGIGETSKASIAIDDLVSDCKCFFILFARIKLGV